VLFISHNMQTVRRLCHRCILLDQGRIVADGSSASIISQFLPDPGGAATPNTWIDLSNVSRRGSGEVRFVAVSYQTDAHRTSALPQPDGPLEFLLAIESDSARSVGSLAVTLYEPSGLKLVNAETKLQGQTIKLREGRTMVRVLIHEVHLNPGVYHVGLWLADPVRVRQSGTAYDHIEPAFAFEIADEVGTANEDMDSPVTCRFEVADVYGAGPTWTAG
jgi:lipopolysaccharide transport system ATP-binding protein